MAAATAREYGNLLIADALRICADEGFVSWQADGAGVQRGETLQHFFDNVFWTINKLFHDAANVQRLPEAEKPLAGIRGVNMVRFVALEEDLWLTTPDANSSKPDSPRAPWQAPQTCR
jgi:hypothetical protein